MPEARVRLSGREYAVIVEEGALDRIGNVASRLRPSARAALVTDDRVGPLLAEPVERALSAAGLAVARLVIPSGESTKSLATVETLCRGFAGHGMDRGAIAVALGGGVVTDIVGFAASVYLRGIAWIAAPTTLQGQLDAAIGGKTGANLPEGKNLVGTIHQPVAVLADVSTLSTLPEPELSSGLAEAVKCGIIGDADLFELLERESATLLARDPRRLEDVVHRCAVLKAEVVSADEREDGRRAILNFGHTIGHAIEASSGYGTYRHGEAVAIGMVAALKLASRRTGLEVREVARVKRLLASIGLPERLRSPLALDALRRAMAQDKKRLAGQVRFVLPEAIGRMRIGVAIPDEEIDQALAEIGATSGRP